jgi:hypothetical protein
VSRNDGRTDALGRAYAGSQLQIQIYVNRRSAELSERASEALPSFPADTGLRRVSPLEQDHFTEYHDRAFLEKLGLQGLARGLSRFWPNRGPVWDALAVAELKSSGQLAGVVLVEGKSYPQEIYGGGCRASSEDSKRLITQALQDTKHWVGADAAADWTGPLYQYANRLAHLHFFRQIAGVSAWLLNVYFAGDPRTPTMRGDWEIALRQVKRELGLEGVKVPWSADLFIDARPRSELFDSPAPTGVGD